LNGVRALIFFGGLLAVVAGRWAQSHSDTSPRYSGGYGSGFSPGSRRFWGWVIFLFGLVLLVSAATGIPADIMRGY